MTMIQEAIAFINNNINCEDEVQRQLSNDEHNVNITVDGGAFRISVCISTSSNKHMRTHEALNLVGEHNCVYIDYCDDAYAQHMNVLKAALIS